MGKIRSGKNVIALQISSSDSNMGSNLSFCIPPARKHHTLNTGIPETLSLEEVRIDNYVFPKIANFEFE
jgi:hypothetical protein